MDPERGSGREVRQVWPNVVPRPSTANRVTAAAELRERWVGPSDRLLDGDQERRLADAVRTTARALSRDLGATLGTSAAGKLGATLGTSAAGRPGVGR